MRPVLYGMCAMESLRTPGALKLVDFAMMNDALDVQMENERRATEAMRHER